MRAIAHLPQLVFLFDAFSLHANRFARRLKTLVLRRGDQTVGRIEHEEIVGVERCIQHHARLVFMHAELHRNPVLGVADADAQNFPSR